MDKKRSIGVTFWALVFVLISVWNLVKSLMDHAKIIQLHGTLLFAITLLSAVAYVVCGIFLLRLSEPARKAAIYLGLISILLIPFYLMPLMKMPLPDNHFEKKRKEIVEQVRPEYQQAALEDLRKTQETSHRAAPVIIGILVGVPLLLLEILPIWFFTRPKVKEQFIEKGSHS